MEVDMERIYKSMKSVGAGNIALGIIMIIIGGAKLLRDKSDITF